MCPQFTVGLCDHKYVKVEAPDIESAIDKAYSTSDRKFYVAECTTEYVDDENGQAVWPVKKPEED